MVHAAQSSLRVVGEVLDIITKLPEAVHKMTGVDVTHVRRCQSSLPMKAFLYSCMSYMFEVNHLLLLLFPPPSSPRQ